MSATGPCSRRDSDPVALARGSVSASWFEWWPPCWCSSSWVLVHLGSLPSAALASVGPCLHSGSDRGFLLRCSSSRKGFLSCFPCARRRLVRGCPLRRSTRNCFLLLRPCFVVRATTVSPAVAASYLLLFRLSLLLAALRFLPSSCCHGAPPVFDWPCSCWWWRLPWERGQNRGCWCWLYSTNRSNRIKARCWG